MAVVKARLRHSKADSAIIIKESAAFLKSIGKQEVVNLAAITTFIKGRGVKPRFGKLVLNELIRNRHLVRRGQKDEITVNYIVVSNLPVRMSGKLSADTFSRIVGSSMTFSATAARLIHKVTAGSVQYV